MRSSNFGKFSQQHNLHYSKSIWFCNFSWLWRHQTLLLNQLFSHHNQYTMAIHNKWASGVGRRTRFSVPWSFISTHCLENAQKNSFGNQTTFLHFSRRSCYLSNWYCLFVWICYEQVILGGSGKVWKGRLEKHLQVLCSDKNSITSCSHAQKYFISLHRKSKSHIFAVQEWHAIPPLLFSINNLLCLHKTVVQHQSERVIISLQTELQYIFIVILYK